MEHQKKSIKHHLICTALFLFINYSYSQTPMYWVGGSGDWTDLTHWVKTSGGVNQTGSFPTEDFNAIIDVNSGLTNVSTITIPPGDYAVNDLTISNISGFKLLFNGTSGANVEMSIHGDLDITSQVNLSYTSINPSHNKWLFVDNTIHDIHTRNLDLLSVRFLTEGATYNLVSHFQASALIRMYAGTWNSNSRNVTAGIIKFEDDEPSNAQLNKVFNTGSSEILCDEWESGLTYGSLTVTGNHTIRTSKFRGSPKQANEPPSSFHEIFLLEYTDIPIGGVNIHHNNFECRSCIIESITIEDTGDTKLADEFTVNGKFTVVNQGSSILFNGGNLRNSEITFNGPIITPKVLDCDDPLTIFSSIHADESRFLKNSGSLDVSDAIVNNIKTETTGGAIFNLSGGVLQGASSGWNLTNPPSSISYYWRGVAGSVEDWDDPNNWVTQSGTSNGCVPKITDDVYIDANAKGDIRIPRPYIAECRNFIWTNNDGLELTLDGTGTLESSLTVTGNFDLNSSAIFTAVGVHEIYFSSATNNYIETGVVALPELLFIGSSGEWTLQDDLNSDQLTFKAGTFNTNGNDVTTDSWNAFDEYPKHFNFGNSTITVNGVMDLAEIATRNVSVDAGTSLIACEVLNSVVTDLYDVQFNNSSTLTLGNYQYNFNSLKLNGTGEVRTVNDLTLENLEFMVNGSSLALNALDELVINGGIESMTSTGSPAVLKSRTAGTQANIVKPLGNLCVAGSVEFVDINAALASVFHAPDGIDGGNNTDINFDDGLLSPTLFWIGESGLWSTVSNWSQVDGGCPASKDPTNAPYLEFNNNSFSSSPAVITIKFPGVTAQDVHFMNAENLSLNIFGDSTFDNLDINRGQLNIIGNKNLIINGSTSIQPSGYLTTDLFNFTTGALLGNGGIFIVKSGSNANINP